MLRLFWLAWSAATDCSKLMILRRDTGDPHRPASLTSAGLRLPWKFDFKGKFWAGALFYFYLQILQNTKTKIALKPLLHQPVNTLTAIIVRNCQQDIREAAWCSASQQTWRRQKSSYITKTQIFQLHHLLGLTESGQTQPHCCGSNFFKTYWGRWTHFSTRL